MYKLKEKEPDFQCCDGPFEGRKFVAGKVYEKIPPEEANRFEEITSVEPDPPRRGRNSNNSTSPSNPSNPEKEV